ncbi:MAG: biogenesis protein MshI [Marinobacter sp.]|uniref:biogenesis protein MshI n=1 Tax=Marinobacter sp. TaxID=50741 RepID=UPI00299CE30C|nr:biogenesis protein MshI [Marinobacter sp.]MDX1635739.1 biogenesis protein MshI [Marinobacter sp.]
MAATRGGDGTAVGYLACTPAKRLEALTQLVSEQGWQGAKTTLVLPLDQYSVFQLERPEELAESELADALRWKLKDLLEYSPSEAVCDVFPFPGDAARGRGELVNVVAARKTLAADLVSLVNQSGLVLDRIDIAELALRNFAAQLDPRNQGVALVHLRDRYGQMVICKGPTLYLSRRLDVTSDDLRDAGRQENAVQSLALEMQRSLDYFESQLGQVPPRAIHLVARDAMLPLSSMLSSYMAPDLETVNWKDHGLSEALDSRCLTAWSAARSIPGGASA